MVTAIGCTVVVLDDGLIETGGEESAIVTVIGWTVVLDTTAS